MISVTTSCFNEEALIRTFIDAVVTQLEAIGKPYEIIVSDNCSTDATRRILCQLAEKNQNLKLILNEGNFGPERSPVNAFFAASGDCVIMLASDLQDPPELIPKFYELWLAGNKVVLGQYTNNVDRGIALRFARALFYWLMTKISNDPVMPNCTGFGIYDRVAIDIMKECADPYPFPRGLVCELGYAVKTVPFEKPARTIGNSRSSVAHYYDLAVTGLTMHSTLPLRLISFLGLIFSTISILVAISYVVLKFVYWESFEMGVAPIVIFTSFMFGVVLFVMGVLAEYIAVLLRYAKSRPLVVENRRINF